MKFILIFLFAFVALQQNDCPINFQLSDALRDKITLIYQDPNQQSYSYRFFSRLFSSSIVIAFSIQNYDIQEITSIFNFYLTSNIQNTAIIFSFNAPNMRWNMISLNFWITSRNDLYVIYTSINNINIKSSNSAIMNIPSNQTSLFTNSIVQINYLSGIYANILFNNFSFSIKNGPVTSISRSLIVDTGIGTYVNNISICSILYDPSSAAFVSYSGTISYFNVLDDNYFNLYSNFMPIYYSMFGLSSLEISGSNLKQLTYSIDIANNYILQLTVNSTINSLTISYSTIGLQPEKICSSCNNYIYIDQCVDICPSNTYSFFYSSGARSCLECSNLLGLRINDLLTGCSCLPGYQLISSNNCRPIDKLSNTCNGLNLVQNGSKCICAPNTYNISGVCTVCLSNQTFNGQTCINQLNCTDPNSQPNADKTSCVCKPNYIQTPALCILNCTNNSQFIPNLNKCQCLEGYLQIGLICGQCKSNQIYNSQNFSCSCIGLNQILSIQLECICKSGYSNQSGICILSSSNVICSSEQIIVNGMCVCPPNSIPVGVRCILCGTNYYADQTAKLCYKCMMNCLNCSNSISCNLCNQGYNYNTTTATCDSPLVSTHLVFLRQGFPKYTTPGIATDFEFNITNITLKKKSQLSSIITMQFKAIDSIPQKVLLSQNKNQPNIFRVFFLYNGLFPIGNFSVLFGFNDPPIGLNEKKTINYQYTSTQSFIFN